MEPQERLPKKAQEIIENGIRDLNQLKEDISERLQTAVDRTTERVKALQEFAEMIPDNLSDFLQITEGRVWIERFDPMYYHCGEVMGFRVSTFNSNTILQTEAQHPKVILDGEQEALIVLAVIPVKKEKEEE